MSTKLVVAQRRNHMYMRQMHLTFWVILVLVFLLSISPMLANQSSSGALGTSIGGSLANAAADVLWRTVKEPAGTFSVGPKQFNFKNVLVGENAKNVLVITNGTESPIEVTSIEVKGVHFTFQTKLVFPMTIAPNTEALLGVGFVPSQRGNHDGKILVLYRMIGAKKQQAMGISLKGRGVYK
jgi:hypothetical protein